MRRRELACEPHIGRRRELARDSRRLDEPGARHCVVSNRPHAGRADGGGVHKMTGNGGGAGGGKIPKKKASAGERDAQQAVVLVH
jgi:hypothetical protein